MFHAFILLVGAAVVMPAILTFKAKSGFGEAPAEIGDSYETGGEFAFDTVDVKQLGMSNRSEYSGLCICLNATAKTERSSDTPLSQIRGRKEEIEQYLGRAESDVKVCVAPDWIALTLLED